MKKVDYIIVGQGLAGSVLSFLLLEKGKTILVIDEEKENTSSRVAAGLCNPVVFKRLTKSWLVDDVLTNAKSFYRQQEKLLGEQFYFDIPIYKLFVDEKEATFWKQKSNEPHLFDWINHKVEHPFNQTYLDHKVGAAKTLQSGYLQTAKWLNHFREFLKKSNSFLGSTFDYSKIEFKEDSIVWNGYEAKQIIFCEGYQSIYNPYFKWLPFKLTKGEVLTVKFKNLKLDAAINKGVFVLPYDNNYKLGATYNWDELNENTSEKGKEELLKKARKFITDKIEIIEHKAGVRPTVIDRRPLIGVHPKHKQLGIFNGLGTKGVMLAPFFAQELVNCLLNNTPLDKEVDINRFCHTEPVEV
tara:strand:- start:4258 stop:5325 length:1068 start_codon:yes stop_codon:yes gene_type:complete